MAWTPPPHWNEVESQLRKSGQVTLDSTGNGTIIFDTDSARQRWLVTGTVVSTNQDATATTIPVATLALNTISNSTMSQGNQRGSSWSGNQDYWSGEIEVGACDFLAVTFSPPPGQSGTPMSGVICTAVITGSKYTRRA